MSSRVLVRFAGALSTCFFLLCSGAGTASAAEPARHSTAPASNAREVCVIRDPRIEEDSGLAASRRHPGIVYTFNDSGNTPRIYALGSRDCRTKAVITVGGAENRDWEAMAVGPDGLYVGDIGDNLRDRRYVTIYKLAEPSVLRTRTLPATAYRFRYPGGARDAETLMVDPRSGRIYIASKEFGGSLYEAPKQPRTGVTNTLRRVADAPMFATDGAFSPDGRTFVIRTYWDADVYSAPGKTLSGLSVPEQKQGEGITYTADGRSFLMSSEGVGQPMWRTPVPAEALPRPSTAPATSRGRQQGAGHQGKGTSRTVLLVAGAVVVGAALLFARRRAS